MNVRISQKEQARIFDDVAADFESPTTQTGKILFRLGELAAAFFLQGHGTKTFSLSRIADIQRRKEMKRDYKRRMEALYRLKQLKLIRTEKRGDELMISLTSKGWTKFLSEIRYRGAKELPGDESCFVSFDIPEDIRDIRRMVRAELKKAEFKLVHQSLWATRLNVAEPLAEVIRQARAERWVSIFIGHQII